MNGDFHALFLAVLHKNSLSILSVHDNIRFSHNQNPVPFPHTPFPTLEHGSVRHCLSSLVSGAARKTASRFRGWLQIFRKALRGP
ncbi:MAG: hypothetical protein HFF17_14980 [Oscillospiraceae bacterium]|nr:hypothetical protein [Oscillospiraceae bacterium]